MSAQGLSAGIKVSHLRAFEGVKDFFSALTLVSIIDIPFLVVFIVVIAYIGGLIFLVPMIAAILILVFSSLVSVPLYKKVGKDYIANAQKTALMFESLSMVELIKSTLAHNTILDQWKLHIKDTASDNFKTRIVSSLIVNLTGLVMLMSNVFMVIFGVYLIHAGTLTLGGLILVIF